MIHAWTPPARFLPYLAWPEIRDMPDKENVVILQPLAAIEQHGPHLPAAVDSVIVAGVLGEALKRLPAEVPCYSLPTLWYGKSNEHIRFPGTVTLTAETLLRVLAEVADSVFRMGFRKLAIVNSHGGQPQVVEIAARDAHERHPAMTVFPLFVWRVPVPSHDALPPREREFGIHAGTAETSLLMALAPDTVKRDRLVREYPQGLPEGGLLSMEGANPFSWLTHDLSASGALGDATAASEELGRRMLDELADGWVKLIGDMHRFRPPRASPGPLA